MLSHRFRYPKMQRGIFLDAGYRNIVFVTSALLCGTRVFL